MSVTFSGHLQGICNRVCIGHTLEEQSVHFCKGMSRGEGWKGNLGHMDGATGPLVLEEPGFRLC